MVPPDPEPLLVFARSGTRVRDRWLAGVPVIGALAIQRGGLLRYAPFWIVLERVIGAVVQDRGLVEHHGLWETAKNCVEGEGWPPRLHQLASCRAGAGAGAGAGG